MRQEGKGARQEGKGVRQGQGVRVPLALPTRGLTRSAFTGCQPTAPRATRRVCLVRLSASAPGASHWTVSANEGARWTLFTGDATLVYVIELTRIVRRKVLPTTA